MSSDAKMNVPDASAPDLGIQRAIMPPHRINPPLSNMGQDREGIANNEQDRVLRNSPMTEASLDLLGAGTGYGTNNSY